MLKRIILIIFLYSFLVEISQPLSAEDSYIESWPQEVARELVYSYIIKDKLTNSRENLENEYIYILDFLDDAINASRENINSLLSQGKSIYRYPDFEDGKLLIREEERLIYSWDKNSKTYYKRIDINSSAEIINIVICIQTYNQLIDFWHEKHGKWLRDTYNLEVVISEVMQLIDTVKNL
jgi:hypothetical protein